MEIPYEFNGATGNSQPHGVVVGEGRVLVFTAGKVIGGTLGPPDPQEPTAAPRQRRRPDRAHARGRPGSSCPPAGGVDRTC